MTKNVKDTVDCVNNLVDISNRIDSFADITKSDVEELVSIMGYSSKIDSVLNWLFTYDEEPSLLHTENSSKNNGEFKLPAGARLLAAEKNAKILELTEAAHAEEVADEALDEALGTITTTLKPTPTQLVFNPEPVSPITLNGEPIKVEDTSNPYAVEKDEVIPQDLYDEEEEVDDEEDTLNQMREDGTHPDTLFNDPNAPDLSSYKQLKPDMLNRVINNFHKHGWLKHDVCDWERNEEYPFMCSENGKFFNLMTNKLEVPYWLAGELFINVNTPDREEKISKRCGIMLATVFHIKRPYSGKTDTWVIDFKNGDRRDLRVDNLTYIEKKNKPSDLVLLLNDICQRCIDNNFDIKKVVKIYEDVKETKVDNQFVSDLINKKERTDITNKYWKLEKGKPVINQPKLPAGNYLNIAEIFERSKDAISCIPLFVQKIDGNYDLNDKEKELLCNLVKRDLPSGSTYSEMSKNMLNTFHWDMTPDEIKAIMLNKTSITTLFNQVG